MDDAAAPAQPLRCPHCGALVVDRRWPNCTTCRAELPAEWVMSREQAAKLAAQARREEAEHKAALRFLDPSSDPNVPGVVKFLNSNVGWY